MRLLVADAAHGAYAELLTAAAADLQLCVSSDPAELAAWAAILAVPTAVAGIYGMNFKYMPELEWTLGYPLALGLMGSVCGFLPRQQISSHFSLISHTGAQLQSKGGDNLQDRVKAWAALARQGFVQAFTSQARFLSQLAHTLGASNIT